MKTNVIALIDIRPHNMKSELGTELDDEIRLLNATDDDEFEGKSFEYYYDL